MSAYPEFIIGAVFVGLYSLDRINNPKIDMNTTTDVRFWSMAGAYAATSILMFVVLSLLVSIRPDHSIVHEALKFIPGSDSLKNVSPPLIIALIMTVLLPKVPGLAKVDEAIRREFRHRASMSRIAGNLSHLLARGNLMLSDNRNEQFMQYMAEQEIGSQNIAFEKSNSPQYLWTKISLLIYEMKDWDDSPVYGHYVRHFHSEWKQLMEEAEIYEAKAARCFTLDVLDSNDGKKNDRLVSAIHDCRKHYVEDLGRLLQRISDFMGRGVAQCLRSPEARRQALMDIGIEVNSNIGYTMHQITVVFLFALVVSITLPILFDLMTQQFDFKIKLYMFKIAFSYACAGLIAVIMHQRMQHFRKVHNFRPWGGYVGAGVLAVCLAIVAGLLIDTFAWLMGFSNRSFFESVHGLVTSSWIYQLRTFGLAILLSYLLDSPNEQPLTKIQLQRRQRIEAAIAALFMAAIALIIYDVINSNPNAGYHLKLGRFLFSSMLLGGVVGYWLPTSVRQIAERANEDQSMTNELSLKSHAV